MTATTVTTRLKTVWRSDGRLSEAPGAVRLRRAVAILFFCYGLLLMASQLRKGDVPSFSYFVILMLSAALWVNRGGRFARDWLAVFLGLYAYIMVSQFAAKLNFSVHYLPQIDFEKAIGFGHIPTVWLQSHLYHGTTGPLEIFSTVMYMSHFLAPLLIGFYLWWSGRRNAFGTLMFSILTVTALGEITFVLAPTAPPWLAAQHGFIPPVHHIIKQALYDLHLTKAAALYADPKSYNIVAAMPSLHAAWPVLGLLVLRFYRLPRWTLVLQSLQLAGVVFAIVYTGEHYLADAIVGAGYAFAGFWLVRKLLGAAAYDDAADAKAVRVPPPLLPTPGVAARIRSALGAEKGQSTLEYAMVVSLVSIAGVGLLTQLGSDVVAKLSDAVTKF
jgi:hypothetical protein